MAVEDSRFYEHNGIDVRGIARALVKDVVKGRMAEGGSTITQQLIKNKYLSGEKTLDRKLKEGLPGHGFREEVHQGPDPGDVFQPDLFRQRGLGHRAGGAALLRQEPGGADRRGVLAAGGGAESARPLQPPGKAGRRE